MAYMAEDASEYKNSLMRLTEEGREE